MAELDADVIISGAGPGGAAAAMVLAQKGWRVLLLDRHRFPRHKTCGDAVPHAVIQLLGRYGMAEKLQAAHFHPVSKLRLSSPRGHTLVTPFKAGENGYIAPRFQFDALLQAHAVASGATFLQATVKEPLLEEGQVIGVRAQVNGRSRTFRSHITIGADGVTSPIARRLRPVQHPPHQRAVAIRAYLEDIETDEDTVEFYLYRGILPGYAWLFPLGGSRANIGLGMRLDYLRRHRISLDDLMSRFLQMPAIQRRRQRGGELQQTATWQLSFGSWPLPYSFDGAMLVGDAAGLINPLTGGGIDNAIISGELAALTADRALAEGDYSQTSLLPYETACRQALMTDLRRADWLQRAFYRFPSLIDLLVSQLRQNNQLARAFINKL